jgi:branched-subunit amino acid transport protein AzlD
MADVASAIGISGPPASVELRDGQVYHLWRRNAVLSILGGTVIYVALVGTLFVG